MIRRQRTQMAFRARREWPSLGVPGCKSDRPCRRSEPRRRGAVLALLLLLDLLLLLEHGFDRQVVLGQELIQVHVLELEVVGEVEQFDQVGVDLDGPLGLLDRFRKSTRVKVVGVEPDGTVG